MRLLRKALCLIAMVLLVSRGTTGGDHPTYDPPPFPDDMLPFPNDPPDPFSDPFDPINDIPDPIDFPLPPEDPIDFPDPLDFPLPPPDLEDPFPDLPSLLPDPFDDLPDVPLPLPDFPPGLPPQPRALTATNLVTKLMPFPMRIPFHPAYSGKSAPKTVRSCNAAIASQLIIPGTKTNTVGFFSTCPWAKTATVAVGTFPVKAAPTPDGTQVLIANVGDGNTSGTISVINIASRAVTKTITFPATDTNGSPVQPNNIAFLPDGSRAYVASHTCNPGSFIYIVDMSSLTVTGTIRVGCYPSAIAVTPDGSQVWVSEHGDSRVDIFDTATNAGVAAFNIANSNGIAFNPTGTTAYIAEGSSPGNIVVIDASSYAVVTRIPVGSLPHVVRVTPSGHHVFVTNALSNNISQISTSTNTVVRTLTFPHGAQHPLGLAFIGR